MHRSQDLACTLCSSALEQATDNVDTVLEFLQIGDKDSIIKNLNIGIHASMESKF